MPRVKGCYWSPAQSAPRRRRSGAQGPDTHWESSRWMRLPGSQSASQAQRGVTRADRNALVV
eukprot:scaffold268359_cov40-Tisochrysis_lutea.AAC.2